MAELAQLQQQYDEQQQEPLEEDEKEVIDKLVQIVAATNAKFYVQNLQVAPREAEQQLEEEKIAVAPEVAGKDEEPKQGEAQRKKLYTKFRISQCGGLQEFHFRLNSR